MTNWHDKAIARANAAGFRASFDEPDSILIADARSNLASGSPADRLAGDLAADLERKAPGPVTRETCAVLVRAAANCHGLAALGLTSSEILTILAAAAAKLEMRAKP